MYLRSMMPRTLVATILLALISAGSISAQNMRRRGDDLSLRQKFEREMMQYLVDFWTPKLGEYKQYIDRSLTQSDLNTVTNLRVRWALYMESEKIRRQAQIEEMRNYQYEASESDDSDMMAAQATADSAMMEAQATADSAMMKIQAAKNLANNAQPQEDGGAEDIRTADESSTVDLGDESATAEIGVAVDEDATYTYDTVGRYSSEGDDEAVETHDCDLGTGYDEDTYVRPVDESELIFTSVTSINDGYRPMYGILDKKVTDDFMTFFDGLLAVRDKFAIAHADEIAADPSAEHWLDADKFDDLAKRREIIEELLSHEGKEVHVIMALYNGGSLSTLLGGMMGFEGITEQAASTPDESTAIAGTSTQLMQNSPNPASTNTVITYRLVEPSSSTRLRVYDPTGQIMADMNLGAIGAGSHETPLNVTTFPTGNYVYHLTVQSSMGEEVYSKVMRVVR